MKPYTDQVREALYFTNHDKEQMDQRSMTIQLYLLHKAERAQYSSLLTVK